MSVHTGIRVRSVLSDIECGKIHASELSNRISELDLAELRELGRELVRRAEQDKEASDTSECIGVIQQAVRRLLDTRNPNGK